MARCQRQSLMRILRRRPQRMQLISSLLSCLSQRVLARQDSELTATTEDSGEPSAEVL